MKKYNASLKTILGLSLAIAGLALSSGRAFAQVLMSTQPLGANGYTYSQNFDSLANTGTANTWTDNSTLPGWYSSRSKSPFVNATYRAGLGTENTGALYSYGTNATHLDSDRALGSVASGTPGAIAYGIRFTNDTGSSLSNFAVSYTGEQYRNGGNASAQRLQFSYQVSAGGVALTSSDAVTNQSWTSFSALDFISPSVGATAMALDGNNATNRTALSASLAGITVLPGQEIFLRWLDVDDPGSDHGLAIDDLTVTFTNVVASAVGPTITADPTNVTTVEGNTVSFAVTVSGSQPFSYQWCSPDANSPISGQTGPTLTLNYVTTGQSGSQYLVIVTNSVNSATSHVATLTVNPAPGPIVTNIAYLHTLHDANFVLTDTTNLYQVEGIVTTIGDLVTTTGGAVDSFFIQDGTGGIDVFFRGGFGYGADSVPAQGDRVRVTAPLLQFNGMLELNPTNANPTHHVLDLDSGESVTPQHFDFSTLPTPTVMEESIEGQYLVVSNVFLGLTNADPHLNAGQTINMTNLAGQVFKIFVANNPNLPAPGNQLPGTFAASVVGVMQQSQSSGTALTNGYNIVLSDLSQITVGTVPSSPVSTTNSSGVLQVVFSPFFSLQGATNVTGPYTTIPGATSPYIVPLTNPVGFYRIVYTNN